MWHVYIIPKCEIGKHNNIDTIDTITIELTKQNEWAGPTTN